MKISRKHKEKIHNERNSGKIEKSYLTSFKTENVFSFQFTEAEIEKILCGEERKKVSFGRWLQITRQSLLCLLQDRPLSKVTKLQSQKREKHTAKNDLWLCVS